ncbi:MAG: hypothetical protein JWR07_1737 [Nevskia sp.]|nr:hypothetical protein [Nevskia sp.]
MVQMPAPGPNAAGAAGYAGFDELLLRLVGAALQILATWAIVHALDPDAAGVYFRGAIISLGLPALLRAKYEIYMAQHIIGRRAAIIGIPDGVLLVQLGRRVLLRSSLVCGVLLVVTADLDIQQPHLQPMLETYLPFVLAIPCVSLSTFIGEALRAANRTMLGTVVASYALNFAMILAVVLAPADAPLPLYTWAYFGGTLVAAALAVFLAWRAFPCGWAEGFRPIPGEVQEAADDLEVIGLGRGLLLWGPLCILAVWAPALEMARYAVAARTALIVDYFLPALNLTTGRSILRRSRLPEQAPRPLLLAQLGRAVLYSTAFVAALLLAAPATLALYGPPYDKQFTVYALLLGMQWANSVGRPAVRHAVADWDARRIRVAVESGALAAVLICALAVSQWGALAAAAASLVGALIVNGRAILQALEQPRRRT